MAEMNCSECQYKTCPQGGFCYMFKDEPEECYLWKDPVPKRGAKINIAAAFDIPEKSKPVFLYSRDELMETADAMNDPEYTSILKKITDRIDSMGKDRYTYIVGTPNSDFQRIGRLDEFFVSDKFRKGFAPGEMPLFIAPPSTDEKSAFYMHSLKSRNNSTLGAFAPPSFYMDDKPRRPTFAEMIAMIDSVPEFDGDYDGDVGFPRSTRENRGFSRKGHFSLSAKHLEREVRSSISRLQYYIEPRKDSEVKKVKERHKAKPPEAKEKKPVKNQLLLKMIGKLK